MKASKSKPLAKAASAGGRKPPARKPTLRKAPSMTRGVRAQERREAIIAAALDEFIARGFAATRLDDVAKRAGVAKGTIYLHFADKEALFQEIIRSVLSPVVVTVESAMHADLPIRAIADRLVE